MRRKRQYPFDRTQKKWDPDKTVELVKYLDLHAEEARQTGTLSPTDVRRKLQASLKKAFSIKRIENKLASLMDQKSKQHFQDVYRIGSDFLRKLDHSTRIKARESLNILRDENLSIQLSTPPRRQLRSTSRNLDIKSTPLESLTLTGVRGRSKSTSVRTTKQLEKPKTLDSIPSEPTVNKVQEPSSSRSIPVPESECSPSRTIRSDTVIPGSDDCAESLRSIDSATERKPLIFPSPKRAADLQPAPPSSFYTTELSSPPAIDYENPNSLQQFPDTHIFDCSDESVFDVLHDNVYWREKWIAEREKTERDRRSPVAARNGDVDLDLAKIIERQHSTILRLKHQNNEQQFLQPFLKLRKEDFTPLNPEQLRPGKVELNLTQMKNRFGSLSIMKGWVCPCSERGVNGLLCRVLSGIQQFASHDHEANCCIGDQVPAAAAVQYLIGTAVCEWVYKARLQFASMMSTPIHEEYKHHLRAICGEVALRNLDFAAHYSLVNGRRNEEHFQEISLRTKATKLAERMFNALSPFVNEKDKRQKRVRIPEVKKQLESIFHCALVIKSQVMVSNAMFDTIWPAPGSRFDAVSMAVENGQSAECSGKIVTVPLVPGLCVYRFDRMFVDYFGFAKGDEETLGKPDIISPAMVFVKD